MPLTRQAILIGAPGDPEEPIHYLRGVRQDIFNYKIFLESLTGGEWRENEIRTIKSPTRRQLLNYLDTIYADYTFTIFSGHGYIDEDDGMTYVNLEGNDIASVYELQTNSDRQTIVVDACRTITSSGISGFGLEKGEIFEAFSGRPTTRQLFDRAVSACEEGTIFVYSTGVNQAAGENQFGGYFSQSILEGADNWYNADTEPFGIKYRQRFFGSKKNN